MSESSVQTSGLKGRLHSLHSQLPYLPRAIALVWQAARPWRLAWLVLLLLQGLLPVATVYLTRLVVDSLVEPGGRYAQSWRQQMEKSQ